MLRFRWRRPLAAAVFLSCGRVPLEFSSGIDPLDGGGLEPATTTPTCTFSGETVCGNDCAVLSTHPRHCGSCNSICAGATPLCNLGSCAAACSSGLTDVRAPASISREDPHHCGACGSTCPPAAFARGWKVRLSTGGRNCAGQCVELAADPDNVEHAERVARARRRSAAPARAPGHVRQGSSPAKVRASTRACTQRTAVRAAPRAPPVRPARPDSAGVRPTGLPAGQSARPSRATPRTAEAA